jgi:hypothetical protein
VPGASPDSPADWPELVGSVAYKAPDAFVLIDPLVPDELWPELGELLRRSKRRRVMVLTTLPFHHRSADEVVRRCWAVPLTRGKAPPDGVELIKIPLAGETMVWLPGPRALVPGDRLLGDGAGGLRMCPPSWLEYLNPPFTHDRLREVLRALLELPVEMVLVSHGDPVLRDGRAAIERALS